ncbi:hypothetical protein GF351_00910 [Candidatus Woesearchaeota archaeon]|nr:hypothetical protein [Candidatus Woesearchaeota archaeon]
MKNIKKSLLFFVMIMMFCSAVNAQYIEEGAFASSQCYVNGQANLPVSSEHDESVDFDDIKIHACIEGTSQCFEVYGTWYDKELQEQLSRIPAEEDVYFVSDEETFTEDGEYRISFSDLPGTDDENRSFEYLVECPGFGYRCSLLQPKIERCFVVDNRIFYAEISGIRGEGIDLLSDVQIQVDWELLGKKVENFYEPPADAEIEETDTGAYTIRFEMTDQMIQNGVDSLRIEEQNCNPKLYNTYSYKSCEKPPTVFCGDSECSEEETPESCPEDCGQEDEEGQEGMTREPGEDQGTQVEGGESPDDQAGEQQETADMQERSAQGLSTAKTAGIIAAIVVVLAVIIYLSRKGRKNRERTQEKEETQEKEKAEEEESPEE